MPRWWHFMHLGVGAFLLVIGVVLFVVFDPHSLWNYVAAGGFVAAGLVNLLASVGFGVDLGAQRLNGQRLAGVGTILLGIAMIAIWVPDLTRGAVAPTTAFGLFSGLLIGSFGVGALYRPTKFGATSRDEARAN